MFNASHLLTFPSFDLICVFHLWEYCCVVWSVNRLLASSARPGPTGGWGEETADTSDYSPMKSFFNSQDYMHSIKTFLLFFIEYYWWNITELLIKSVTHFHTHESWLQSIIVIFDNRVCQDHEKSRNKMIPGFLTSESRLAWQKFWLCNYTLQFHRLLALWRTSCRYTEWIVIILLFRTIETKRLKQ